MIILEDKKVLKSFILNTSISKRWEKKEKLQICGINYK